MTTLCDREAFAAAHRAHGPIWSGVNEPTEDGYRAWAVCSCLAVWHRWVSATEADHEMIWTDFLAVPN